jgi:esterase/lipase
MKEWLIRLVVALAVLVVVVIAATWVAGADLTEPANRDITRPPPDLEASNVTFASGSGSLIHAWLSHGQPGQGVILLLHGVRGDRRDMVARAEFLHSRGYTVLLPDFQAHGESRGRRITFGNLESRDVTAALQYLRHKMPDERVGVIGATLGADAFVLSDERPAVAAVVLEQMYPTIQQAVANRARLHLGGLGAMFAPLLMVQMQSRLEIPENRLRPIDRLPKLAMPVFFINGADDDYSPTSDAQSLLSAAREPKQLWLIEGAGHVDLYAYAKSKYEERVGEFFDTYVRSGPRP